MARITLYGKKSMLMKLLGIKRKKGFIPVNVSMNLAKELKKKKLTR